MNDQLEKPRRNKHVRPERAERSNAVGNQDCLTDGNGEVRDDCAHVDVDAVWISAEEYRFCL